MPFERCSAAALAPVIVAFCSAASPGRCAEPPATGSVTLVVLSETGETRAGFPVLRPHPDPRADLETLSRGLSATMLRLYRFTQAYLNRREGRRVEPAYLLRSGNRGGFPRTGFWLGQEDKRGAGYVDLHRRNRLTGVFGAVDQIFPHELAHLILTDVAGGPKGGCGSNQIHALGVRTDPVIAFHEGFAEHFQVLAIDDPDAAPETRRLATDVSLPRHIARELGGYRRAMQAAWSAGSRSRLGFLLWFGGIEQAMRYHAVKANAFSRAPAIPPRLLETADPYAAYLLQSVLSGEPSGAPRPAAVALSIEGVVAAFFTRWSADERIRGRYRDAAFYEAFGASASSVSPLENVYLKILHAWYRGKPRDTRGAVASYAAAFPDEAPFVQDVLEDVLGDQAPAEAPQIWLANPAFRVGTSLYDQFRGQPRIHTFDLNAATLVDLVSVPGVSRQLADKILAGSPYAALASLREVPGINDAGFAEFERMARQMERLRKTAGDSEESLDIRAIVMPSVRRGVFLLLLAAAVSATLYRRIEGAGRVRAAANGFGASLLGLGLGWVVSSPFSVAAVIGPLVVFAVPAALLRVLRRRLGASSPSTERSVGRLLLAWAGAALPALLLLQPL